MGDSGEQHPPTADNPGRLHPGKGDTGQGDCNAERHGNRQGREARDLNPRTTQEPARTRGNRVQVARVSGLGLLGVLVVGGRDAHVCAMEGG